MTPAPPARLGRSVAFIVLLSFCGCADGRSLLTLSVDAGAAISGIDHLRVLLTDTARGKTASEIDVPVPGGMLPPVVTANIALNAQVKGTVAVAVDAIESSGKVLGSGASNVSVAPSKTAMVGVTLAPTTLPGTPVATSLAFMAQPTSALTDDPLGTVAVQVLDQNGVLLSTASTSVAVAIGKNPSGGFLSGKITVAAVNGVATFSGLSINEIGSGYSLVASASGLPSVTSNAFDVTPRPFHEINSGLEGGFVESMVLASADPSVMYITCVGGGVFKSLDGGAHWVDIDSTLTALNYLGITADPRNADSIWMTTGSGALVHSSDGGASWSTAASGLPASPASSIVVDPTSSSTVYVATSGQGIYKATDGITFTSVSTGLGDQNVQDLIMSPQSPTTLYAATRSGGASSRSTAGGAGQPSTRD